MEKFQTVRNILLILFGAFLLFMGLSIVEKWASFQPFFSGHGKAGKPKLPEDVLKTLKEFHTLLIHLYQIGPDPRFLAHLPASQSIRDEIAGDLAYLGSYRVRQKMESKGVTLIDFHPLSPQTWEVITEETWEITYLTPEGKPLQKKPKSFVGVYRYVVTQKPTGWQIVKMEPAP